MSVSRRNYSGNIESGGRIVEVDEKQVRVNNNG